MSEIHVRRHLKRARSVSHLGDCNSEAKTSFSFVLLSRQDTGTKQVALGCERYPTVHNAGLGFSWISVCSCQREGFTFPWHQKQKKEVNADLMTFFHKNGDLCGTLRRQPSSVQSAGSAGALSSARSLLPQPRSAEGHSATARESPLPQSLPAVLNTRCRQPGSSLKLQRACQPVSAERLSLNASSKKSEKNLGKLKTLLTTGKAPFKTVWSMRKFIRPPNKAFCFNFFFIQQAERSVLYRATFFS